MTHLTAADLLTFRRQLEAIGIDDATIAEAIRLGGNRLPLFAGQIRGQYVYSDGSRYAHFNVPGWYAVERVAPIALPVVNPSVGPAVTLRSERGARFDCDGAHLRAGLDLNLALIADGHPL